MPYALFDIVFSLPHFVMILFRIGGLMLTAPMLASSIIPVRIRAAMAMALSFMMLPVLAQHAPTDLQLIDVIRGGIGELMIGATIGLALTMVLLGADIAGLLVGQQGGLALGEIFDPMMGRQSTVTGQLYSIVLTMMFLVVGGHRAMIASLLDTYKVIPMVSFEINESIVLMMVEAITAAFVVAIRVSGPVLIALFLMGTALGFLSRTMPQFNILSVGFTMRVMVAIGAAGLALSACRDLLLDSIWDGLELARSVLGLRA